MDAQRKHLGAGVLAGVIGTLLALILTMLVVAYGGIYNVSAGTGHTAISAAGDAKLTCRV